MNVKFGGNLILLTPILTSLLVGTLCALLILSSSIEIFEITPFPEGPSGAFGNAFYFVIIIAVGASLIYLLLKWKKRKLINLIIGFALTTAIFMLSIIYVSAMFPSIPNAEILILTLSILITTVVDLAIFWLGGKACNLAIVCLGGALGTFFGAGIPPFSAILILVFLAVYDVFTVFYGPVGKIASIGLDKIKGLSFSFKEIQMGLGDLTFYSMLSGNMLFNFGFFSYLASVIGILFGCLLLFKMLEKKGMFPGLPFPIFSGLTAGFLALLILF